MTWNQTDFLDGSVNATVDPYYLCFLDDTTPTATVAGFLAPTVDFTANLSGNLISGVTEPCVVTRPQLIASRPGGKFLNGQRRDIPVAHPYVRGSIMLRPGTPADHRALIEAAAMVTRVWIVPGGAYPRNTPAVWPFLGADNTGRFQRSSVFATSITLKKQSELDRAQLVSGAMNLEIGYEGRLSGPLP